jgi:peptidoglycan LD-endopeptidase LytH
MMKADFLQVSPCGALVPFDLSGKVWVPDLTAANPDLHTLDLADTEAFTAYMNAQMQNRGVKVALGGYGEDRFLYHRSPHFSGAELRTIHLGIDLWADAGTPVMAPLPGKVHSFANNAAFGDYGYTILLEHTLESLTFYTLYGHLSADSVENLTEGDSMEAGETFARLGEPHENGNWTPHLHFQIMLNLMGKRGDFPGVAARSEKDFYLQNCPDPNLILQSKWL